MVYSLEERFKGLTNTRNYYKNKSETISRQIVEDKSKLEVYQREVDKLVKIDKELADSKYVLDNLENYYKTLYNLIKICTKKSIEFKDVRVNSIESEITNNLAYLYPEKNYEVKIDFSESRGDDVAELLLGSKGKLVPTTGQNGMFVRQVISLTGMEVINYMHGGCVLFLDEALASSDKQNLLKLKPMFNRMIEKGFQIIMIEHKPEIYQNLKHKRFKLYRHKEREEVIVYEIIYNEGE